jgi:hypothetical protein
MSCVTSTGLYVKVTCFLTVISKWIGLRLSVPVNRNNLQERTVKGFNRKIGCLVLTFALLGCAGTAEERRQMRNEGITLHSIYGPYCAGQAWKVYPSNIQSVEVTKQRKKRVSTGSTCEPSITFKDKTNCTNVYKNVTENYTVNEQRDVNQKSRDSYYLSCREAACNKEIGPILEVEGDGDRLLLTKLRKCIRG